VLWRIGERKFDGQEPGLDICELIAKVLLSVLRMKDSKRAEVKAIMLLPFASPEMTSVI